MWQKCYVVPLGKLCISFKHKFAKEKKSSSQKIRSSRRGCIKTKIHDKQVGLVKVQLYSGEWRKRSIGNCEYTQREYNKIEDSRRRSCNLPM